MKDELLSKEDKALYMHFMEAAEHCNTLGKSPHSFSRERWKHAAASGLTGPMIPKQWGGKGLSMYQSVLAYEAFGFGCHDTGLAFGLGAHALSCVTSIWEFGSENQREQWLLPAVSGELIIGHGISEPESGSDAFSMRTTAKKQNDYYQLDGRKHFTSNAEQADAFLVYAKTSSSGYFGGISAFILSPEINGFSRGISFTKSGLPSCSLGSFFMEEVMVSNKQLIGAEGMGGALFSTAMNWERLGLAAIHLGQSRWVLDCGLKIAQGALKSPLKKAAHQALIHELMHLKTKCHAARLLVHEASKNFDAKKATDGIYMSKLMASELYVETALKVSEILATLGHEDNRVSQAVLDSPGSRIYSGSNEMILNLMAGNAKL